MPHPATGGALRVRVYPVLADAVDRGVEYGYHRAHKHTDNPDEHQITSAIRDAVLTEILEAFTIEEPDE